MPHYYNPLFPEKKYHIFSRATGNEQLFEKEENYLFFLQKFKQHVLPIADVWAWCLLPNHFHFMVEIKPIEIIALHFSETKKGKIFNEEAVPDFLMERFSNLLNSYTKAFNKVNQRKGSLFMDYLRRVEITEDAQLGATIFYIHKNPVHHGYCKKLEDWRWSSYKAMLSNAPTMIKRMEVLDWFGSVPYFIRYHEQDIYLKNAVVQDL